VLLYDAIFEKRYIECTTPKIDDEHALVGFFDGDAFAIVIQVIEQRAFGLGDEYNVVETGFFEGAEGACLLSCDIAGWDAYNDLATGCWGKVRKEFVVDEIVFGAPKEADGIFVGLFFEGDVGFEATAKTKVWSFVVEQVFPQLDGGFSKAVWGPEKARFVACGVGIGFLFVEDARGDGAVAVVELEIGIRKLQATDFDIGKVRV
jgi:hypothetical protein